MIQANVINRNETRVDLSD